MSELRADTITASNGTGPVTLTKQSAAKVWVNFNGTGTIAIRGSQNVSGLVDNGTGNYTVNISNSFSAETFSVTNGGNSYHTDSLTDTSGAFDVQKYNSAHSNQDATDCYFNAHGDLA